MFTMRGKQTIMLVVFVLVAFLPSLAGARFMPGAWYAGLVKPSFNPPSWVFGPVWTVLYLSIGIAAWLVWRKSGVTGAWLAFSVFAAQLVFNGLWTWLFFGLHRPGMAFVDILLLLVSIVAMALAYWPHSRVAALMMIPYFAWVSFASALNFAFWRLNG